MPCQICGKYSAFYPLCKKHFNMKDRGLVKQCSMCGVWFKGTKDKCSQCSAGVIKSKDLVHINRNAFKKWAKSLYTIGQAGLEYLQNEEDEIRYRNILSISSKFSKILKEKRDDNPLAFEVTQLEYWSDNLFKIAKDGLKSSDNSYDIARYNNLLSVQEGIISAIEGATTEIVSAIEGARTEIVSAIEGSRTSNLESISDSSASRSKKSSDKAEIARKTKTRIQKPLASVDQEFISDRLIQKRIIEMINRAEREILIASPWIWESEEVLHALTSAIEDRRIRVRLMTRPAKNPADKLHKEQIRALHKIGFQIELEEYLHAKLILVDDRELLIGSANLVGNSLKRNYEAALWTNHQKTVQDAKIYFTDLMAEIFARKLST